jgi:hypothetical protein
MRVNKMHSISTLPHKKAHESKNYVVLTYVSFYMAGDNIQAINYHFLSARFYDIITK